VPTKTRQLLDTRKGVKEQIGQGDAISEEQYMKMTWAGRQVSGVFCAGLLSNILDNGGGSSCIQSNVSFGTIDIGPL